MPSSGISSRLHSRSKVVFPAPDGPVTTVIPAAGIAAVIWSSTRRPARTTLTRSNSSATVEGSLTWPAFRADSPLRHYDAACPTCSRGSTAGCHRPARPGSVGTAQRLDVLLRGHAVQPDRIWVAEHQVEHPPAVRIEPVVRQLLAADLVMHQPRPTRATRADALGLRQSLRTARAVLVPLEIVGPGDDRLAAGVPPRVHRAVVTRVVVV